MAFHPKAIQAGNCALGLWVRAGAWAASAKTDGYITRQMAHHMGTHMQVEALITCGLWEVKDDGYVMHDWHHYQIPKADIESRRESDRLRKREQRKREKVTRDTSGQVTRDTSGHVTPSVTRDPHARAYPIPLPIPSGGGVGNATHHADDPRPPPCQKHPNGPKHNEPCRECQQTRQYDEYTQLKHAETLRQFWEQVENCDQCSPKGWIETDNAAERCPNHDWTMLI